MKLKQPNIVREQGDKKLGEVDIDIDIEIEIDRGRKINRNAYTTHTQSNTHRKYSASRVCTHIVCDAA